MTPPSPRLPACRARAPHRALQAGLHALLGGAAVLLTAGAHAQASTCDEFKATLAARIDATGARGYSLDTAPAATRVPPGAKVIGRCDSGATVILYRRWGSGPPASAAAAASQVVPARTPAPATPPPAPPPPTTAPLVAVAPATLAAPAASPSLAGAPASAAPPRHAAELPVANATDAASAAGAIGLSDRAAAFVNEHWRWLAVLLLVPVAGAVWAWRAHRGAYDAAGLPRGPRLG